MISVCTALELNAKLCWAKNIFQGPQVKCLKNIGKSKNFYETLSNSNKSKPLKIFPKRYIFCVISLIRKPFSAKLGLHGFYKCWN